jgi:hypothetical protein
MKEFEQTIALIRIISERNLLLGRLFGMQQKPVDAICAKPLRFNRIPPKHINSWPTFPPNLGSRPMQAESVAKPSV